MLVGVRSLDSTGCKPLDEHLVLGQRHFKTLFAKPGQSDLDDIKAELKPGTPKDAVRLVKTGRPESRSVAVNVAAMRRSSGRR